MTTYKHHGFGQKMLHLKTDDTVYYADQGVQGNPRWKSSIVKINSHLRTGCVSMVVVPLINKYVHSK